ncbi:hypothetical protein AB4354_23630 [Vibrio splendidus]|uniref:hypothetical protein n=1 Tax=Vibrio splendidus TaxID=29497 RepID=UPI000C841AC9|nr:hypothetical protein [Vibrio splendidus]PMH04652.1 hypothetical protein BCU75_23120 [Vibrio splendidus]
MGNELPHFGGIDSMEKEIDVESVLLKSKNDNRCFESKIEFLMDCFDLKSIEEINFWNAIQSTEFERIEDELLRDNSSKCIPDINSRYYALESKIYIRPKIEIDKVTNERWLFKLVPDYKLSSLMSRWERDNENKTLEIRQPSQQVETNMLIDFYRNELKEVVYIINGAVELLKWLHCWGGKAFILEDLFEDEIFHLLFGSFECEK